MDTFRWEDLLKTIIIDGMELNRQLIKIKSDRYLVVRQHKRKEIRRNFKRKKDR